MRTASVIGSRLRRGPSEHETQAGIVDALRLAGFTVRETTAYRQKGASGVDKGIPDLLVRHPLIDFLYLGIEVKRPGNPVWSSPEQKAAFEDCEFVLAQSPADALDHALVFLNENVIESDLKAFAMNKARNVHRGVR